MLGHRGAEEARYTDGWVGGEGDEAGGCWKMRAELLVPAKEKSCKNNLSPALHQVPSPIAFIPPACVCMASPAASLACLSPLISLPLVIDWECHPVPSRCPECYIPYQSDKDY